MQRRWATIYIVFFLVMGIAAYGVMAVADAPEFDLDGETYENGSTFELDGTTYTVVVEDGEGSLEYTEVTEQSETVNNESEIEIQNTTYQLVIEPGDEPEEFLLEQVFDVEQILADDPEVENETVTREDGNEYVVYREDGRTELLEDYLPEPDRAVLGVGDSIDHEGETKTVTEIASGSVTFEWEGEEQLSEDLNEGRPVEIGDREFVAHFPDAETVILTEDVEEYERQTANQDYFQERLNGFLFVIILSGSSIVLLSALAFIPHRGD